jgi:acyl-CoA thioesterase FadM
MVFAQEAYLDASDILAAEARVVAVWVGPDRKPMRIPDVARAALG